MKSVIDRLEEERKVEYNHMQKIPYTKIKKGYKKIYNFMIPVYISIIGMIIAFPIWIWINWEIAWKLFLTSLFLFFVFNGIFNLLKKIHIQYKEHLDNIDKIDYNT